SNSFMKFVVDPKNPSRWIGSSASDVFGSDLEPPENANLARACWSANAAPEDVTVDGKEFLHLSVKLETFDPYTDKSTHYTVLVSITDLVGRPLPSSNDSNVMIRHVNRPAVYDTEDDLDVDISYDL